MTKTSQLNLEQRSTTLSDVSPVNVCEQGGTEALSPQVKSKAIIRTALLPLTLVDETVMP
jgi:hypothetical protein